MLTSAVGIGGLATRAQAKATSASDIANALKASGDVRVADGVHKTTSKLQTVVPNTVIGDSRHNTVLQPSAFSDYVLEVGNGTPGPNAGKIQRLRFYGAPGNLGCLHMNTLSHMWRLEELLFSGGPCPAMVMDNCWDSNYTDIDILAHVTVGTTPAKCAAVIFRNGCNNIYCRGLRIEGAHSGGIYTDGGPIYIVTGKIDDGFGGPQSAAAITVTSDGHLVLEDFYLGGMLNQFHIDVAGTLKLGRVFFDGGSNRAAAINDHRAWRHWNAATAPSFSRASMGPDIPVLDLGEAEFRRVHPSVDTETPAAVYSKIHPVRQVQNLTATANGAVSGNTITVGTNLRPSHNDLYKDSFLVHNATGMQAGHEGGARRKILKSFVDGNLVVQGPHAVTVDSDWSIEYCATHCTPIRYENAWLAREQRLFAVVSGKATITSALSYISTPADAAYGTTKFKLQGDGLARGQDVTGLYLIDNATEDPYYIQYGIDDHNFIGVMYDRRAILNPTNEFSVVAGYVPNVATKRSRLTRIVSGAAGITVDISFGNEFEITAANAGGFAISNPVNAPAYSGHRITISIRNEARAQLGAVLWGNAYKLATWTSPAPAHSRSIDFRYDGKNWVEVGRTPADVPN